MPRAPPSTVETGQILDVGGRAGKILVVVLGLKCRWPLFFYKKESAG